MVRSQPRRASSSAQPALHRRAPRRQRRPRRRAGDAHPARGRTPQAGNDRADDGNGHGHDRRLQGRAGRGHQRGQGPGQLRRGIRRRSRAQAPHRREGSAARSRVRHLLDIVDTYQARPFPHS